jgi:hypothetical protein
MALNSLAIAQHGIGRTSSLIAAQGFLVIADDGGGGVGSGGGAGGAGGGGGTSRGWLDGNWKPLFPRRDNQLDDRKRRIMMDDAQIMQIIVKILTEEANRYE